MLPEGTALLQLGAGGGGGCESAAKGLGPTQPPRPVLLPQFPMGPGSDGPMGGMGGMEPHHMNGSLGKRVPAPWSHCTLPSPAQAAVFGSARPGLPHWPWLGS